MALGIASSPKELPLPKNWSSLPPPLPQGVRADLETSLGQISNYSLLFKGMSYVVSWQAASHFLKKWLDSSIPRDLGLNYILLHFVSLSSLKKVLIYMTARKHLAAVFKAKIKKVQSLLKKLLEPHQASFFALYNL